MTETQEHIAFADWLRFKNIPFFHPANGGKRTIVQASLFKRMGVVPGIPDFIILRAPRGYRGIAIEMKAQKGVVSSLQKEMLAVFERERWKTHVAYGFVDAKEFIEGLVLYQMQDWENGPAQ